jgi:PII-like signaling protein
MPNRMAVQVSIYLNEADQYQRRPLHLEILRFLHSEHVSGATVLHAVAGFTGDSRIKSSSLVDAGGKLPLVVVFIDEEEHVQQVLPRLKEMAPHRLIVRENVVVEQGLA